MAKLSTSAKFYKANKINTNCLFPYFQATAAQVKKHFGKNITSVSIKDIANLFEIDLRSAESQARAWVENEGGKVVCCADLHCYYFQIQY